MKAEIQVQTQQLTINLSQPIDISLAITNEADAASAWYCPPARIEPVMTEHFVGDVNKGGAVNFRNVSFNPHGNGTHTECVGHISKEWYSINKCLKEFFFIAKVITVQPQKLENGDAIIDEKMLEEKWTLNGLGSLAPKAIVIRTEPNTAQKRKKQYTNSNPPYMTRAAMKWVVEKDIEHLLIDTPSVDKEQDGGALAAHHIFWNYPEHPRLHCTITELVYVPNSVPDGLYLLNLQVASFENDASPSRPVLFEIK
ncbi:MAG: cyclase family protein [Aureispira sp.]|nr:cyclase family protein [Aureispira sp.]